MVRMVSKTITPLSVVMETVAMVTVAMVTVVMETIPMQMGVTEMVKHFCDIHTEKNH